jgi:hypothetical protein
LPPLILAAHHSHVVHHIVPTLGALAEHSHAAKIPVAHSHSHPLVCRRVATDELIGIVGADESPGLRIVPAGHVILAETARAVHAAHAHIAHAGIAHSHARASHARATHSHAIHPHAARIHGAHAPVAHAHGVRHAAATEAARAAPVGLSLGKGSDAERRESQNENGNGFHGDAPFCSLGAAGIFARAQT